jgi:hypothetical protein
MGVPDSLSEVSVMISLLPLSKAGRCALLSTSQCPNKDCINSKAAMACRTAMGH